MLDAGCVQVSLAPMTAAMAMAIYSAITRCDKMRMRMGSVQATTSTDRVRTQPPGASHQPVTVSPSGQRSAMRAPPHLSKTHHLPFNTQYSPPIPITQYPTPGTHHPLTQYSLAPHNRPRVPADSRSVPVRRRATMQTMHAAARCTYAHTGYRV